MKSFLIFKAKIAFIKLRQVFIEAPILQHFNSKCHIRIKTEASGYAIGGILSQLTLDNLDQWHLIAYFSKKMILAKIRYKTHDSKFLATFVIFKN